MVHNLVSMVEIGRYSDIEAGLWLRQGMYLRLEGIQSGGSFADNVLVVPLPSYLYNSPWATY